MNKYDDDIIVNGIIDPSKSKDCVKEYQTVVEVGPMVRDIKVGDIVHINPSRYAVMKHKEGTLKDNVVKDNMVISYKFNIVVIDDVPHLLLEDRDVNYIIEEYEENKSTLIKPKGKKLIV